MMAGEAVPAVGADLAVVVGRIGGRTILRDRGW